MLFGEATVDSSNANIEVGEVAFIAPKVEDINHARQLCDTFMQNYKGTWCTNLLLLERRSGKNEADKSGQLKRKLDERLWRAACWRDYQLAITQRIYDDEINQIEHDFRNERELIRERLLAELHEHRRRIMEARESASSGLKRIVNGASAEKVETAAPAAEGATSSNNARVAARKLRNKREEGKNGPSNNTAGGGGSSRRKQGQTTNDKPLRCFILNSLHF